VKLAKDIFGFVRQNYLRSDERLYSIF